MYTSKTFIRSGGAVALVLLLCVSSGCAVVSLEDGSILYGARQVAEGDAGADDAMTILDAEFDADQYVESIWESQVLPELETSAMDLTEVKQALAQDYQKACEECGVISNDKSSWVFVVSAEGTLKDVNRESRNGIATIEIEGENAPYTIQLQIGPVYKGASLRDALPFIKFSDFKNQVDFSSISSALNRKVDTDIIPAANLEESIGQTIRFTGAFSIKNEEDDMVVTPIAWTRG